MEFIKKIIEKQNPSFEELINCFEKIKANGEVAVIKFDGERESDEYTVFVSFPKGERKMIRSDESDLKDALLKVLTKYVVECPPHSMIKTK
jgi:hypothetical protein